MDRIVAASTWNQTLAALGFLDKIVLDRAPNCVDNDLVGAKRSERLPLVLARDAAHTQLKDIPD